MSGPHCSTCQCHAEVPTYPVTCGLCGVTFGPGGEVRTHRQGSMACLTRRYSRDLLSSESLSKMPHA